MKRWQGSCIGAFVVLLIGGLSLFFFVPVGGAMLVGVPPVFDAITERVVCPDAVIISKEEYNQGPVTTSPSGMTGHQEEWTCTFEDGTQKVVPNEVVAVKGIGVSFAVSGICSGLILFLLAILGAVIGGMLVKPKSP
jgi:hypothetical protein